MQSAASPIESQVWEKLKKVTDPEIPTVSLIEMGMVEKVTIDGKMVTVNLIPTFIGCPALTMMEEDVIEAVSEIDEVEDVQVVFLKNPIWTSDRISVEAWDKLKQLGIAPPPKENKQAGVWEIDCPYCGSKKTYMNNVFGPTACRSIFYCNTCKNPFEEIKPV
jgi:ring-1,2-phenylacetyl-CoA epoxidase subunit PaaD